MLYTPLHLEDMWWYQSSWETPILSRIMSLNQFCVRIPFMGLLLHKKHTKHCLKRVLNWIKPQVCNPCSTFTFHLEELWWYQSSSTTPILWRILSLNQFCVRISFLGLLFHRKPSKHSLKSVWTEENQRSVVLVLHLPLILNICGGLNHHQRHQYCQQYCLWTSFL